MLRAEVCSWIVLRLDTDVTSVVALLIVEECRYVEMWSGESNHPLVLSEG
jgi:hypothetical protein